MDDGEKLFKVSGRGFFRLIFRDYGPGFYDYNNHNFRFLRLLFQAYGRGFLGQFLGSRDVDFRVILWYIKYVFFLF